MNRRLGDIVGGLFFAPIAPMVFGAAPVMFGALAQAYSCAAPMRWGVIGGGAAHVKHTELAHPRAHQRNSLTARPTPGTLGFYAGASGI